jgi:release factor glutamine methyltransferase
MKLHEAGQLLGNQLKAIYTGSEASNIAALVLEVLTGLTSTERIMQKDLLLTTGQLAQLDQYTKQLLQHEPVQYVLQKAWFYGLELYVDPNVLIPRPETEELVHWIVRDVRLMGKDVFESTSQRADGTTELKILDIGTGSGCIALALKKSMPRSEVWGCDLSDEALNVARRNGSSLDIRVDFQSVDFLDASQQKHLPTVDIIVSNPPYIPLKDQSSMHPNVLLHEPHTALFVPDEDPLLFYKALASFGKLRLHSPGAIYMEIHEDLGDAVLKLFQSEGYTDVSLKKDMQGKNRMTKAEL